MTIAEIYTAYTAGSTGFVIAVETNCGYDISRTEIARIAEVATTAEEFERVWENEDWWTDENNQ